MHQKSKLDERLAWMIDKTPFLVKENGVQSDHMNLGNQCIVFLRSLDVLGAFDPQKHLPVLNFLSGTKINLPTIATIHRVEDLETPWIDQRVLISMKAEMILPNGQQEHKRNIPLFLSCN